MKKILTSALAIAAALPVFANLNTMNYQAIITGTDGEPVINQKIGLKFTILSEDGIAYSEMAGVTSDDKGLVSWEIGSSEGGLAGINWGAANYILEVSVDLNGGQDYSSVYISTIQSVPTALYSVNGEEALNEARNTAFVVNNMSEKVDFLNNVTEDFFNEQMALNENYEMALTRVMTEMEDLQQLPDQVDAFATMTETRLDKMQAQIDSIDGINDPEELANLIDNVNNLNEWKLNVGADVARIDGLSERMEILTDSVYNNGLDIRDLYAQMDEFKNKVWENEVTRADLEEVFMANEKTQEFATQIQNGVNILEEKVDINTKEIENLKQHVDNANQNIADLQVKVDEFSNKVWENEVTRTDLQEVIDANIETQNFAKSLKDNVDKNTYYIEELREQMGTVVPEVTDLRTNIDILKGQVDNISGSEVTYAEFEELFNKVSGIDWRSEENFARSIQNKEAIDDEIRPAIADLKTNVTGIKADLTQIQALAQLALDKGSELAGELAEKVQEVLTKVDSLQPDKILGQMAQLQAEVSELNYQKSLSDVEIERLRVSLNDVEEYLKNYINGVEADLRGQFTFEIEALQKQIDELKREK